MLPSEPFEPILQYWPHLRDLGIAYGLALLIGWNREKDDRSAGMRTFPLVAVATCMFVQASEQILKAEPEGVGQLLSGIITGIGFIGGGAILKSHGRVHGTATAAALWISGAIGMAVGLEKYDLAIIGCGFTVATLYVMTRLKKHTGDKIDDQQDDDDKGK